MAELRKMADSIHPMIQLEEDNRQNHPDNKLPILDLKVWVAKTENGSKLLWQYYRKPMSNQLLIPAASAMAMSIKRTTSLDLDWDLKADMLSNFCERMRDSGYDQKFRSEIIDSVLRGWDKMVKTQERGGRPIN